jgi:hypothetical protein
MPNPSAGSVRLSYSLPRSGSLTVLDVRGRVVHACTLGQGSSSVTIPSNVLQAAGVYMAVVRADGLRETTRFVHLR